MPRQAKEEVAERARTVLCERHGGAQYGAFFASAVSDMLRDPECDLTETWTRWRARRAARMLEPDGERFIPEFMGGQLIEAEHVIR